MPGCLCSGCPTQIVGVIYARIILKTALNGGEWDWWYAMTGQADVLEECISFRIYPVLILLVLVL